MRLKLKKLIEYPLNLKMTDTPEPKNGKKYRRKLKND